MPRYLFPIASAALLAFTISLTAAAQAVPACGAPPAILAPNRPNIFSEQQEQWLGDAMADLIETDYKPIKDPALNAYLDRITQRLLAVLPPTHIQFRVVLVDSAEVNGFSLAGGRVYLTRKLVANARSEDEVAAVIAHEMGHILSHQFAVETTADFKRLLGVTSVTDKADIYVKFQRLMDASLKDKHPGPGGDTDEKQDQADQVAVYAAAAAGYRPQAYADFWDRNFFVDGKVGGALSDFFGTTKPESKRLRAILKLVTALPHGCGATQDSASADFKQWHDRIVANQAGTVEASAKPLSQVALTPPLRMDLERLRFSRDGKEILAQDESSIFVLTRDPFASLFRFDAEKALPAEFSPDSQRIVFHTPGLHTEEWSIPEQKLLTSHEPVARDECIQSKISPDGRTIFCVSIREEDDGLLSLDLSMLDAATGEVLFKKKGFFVPSYNFLVQLALSRRSSIPLDVMPGSFSADGNILLLGPYINKLAFDLRTRATIPLGKDLKNTITGPYAFLGSDKVLGIADSSKDSGVFSFPEGKRLQTVPLSVSDLESVTDGGYILTHSIPDYAVGLADVSAGRFIVESKAPSMDVWNGLLLNENPDGSIILHKLNDKTVEDKKATLPLSPLGPRLLAATSADGRYLALSTRTRGGVWDLLDGNRILLSRQFTSAVFSPDNTLFAEFPKSGKEERSIVHFYLNPLSTARLTYKVDDTMGLSAGMMREWKPSGKKGIELIVHNVSDNAVLWSRTFEFGEPAHTPNIIPGTTIFSFPFATAFAKAHLKTEAALAAPAATIKNRDAGRLIQVVDDKTGNLLHELVLEVPATYEGVDGINIVGDLLYLSSSDNRTMLYNLATGAQLRQIFGYVIAADPASGRICAVNRRDEAIVYDAEGHEIAHFQMGSPLRFATFQDGQTPGSRLVLLTADQQVRTMAIAPASPPPALAATPAH